ncbi:MAG: class I tRNA ligase family protein, partial [Candidatus Atribacteria bacterium]|nr:class I tRNA ligase family protein [Candidatus Atribacteria bacterium]
IWNSSRFVLMNLTDYQPVNLSDCPDLDLKDRWILSRLQRTILMTQEALSGFNFGQYTQLIYDFIWSEFCDWFIEWSKADLYRGTPEKKRKTQNLLIFLLRLILKLLHPVAPFITEEIWQSLPGKETESIMITSWPKAEERWIDPVTERLIIQVQDIIREVRYLRAELSISPAETCAVFLNFTDPALYEVYATYQGYIEQLAKCEIIKGAMDFTKPEGTVTSRTDGVDVSITVAGLIDVEKEKQRLEKKCAILTADNERTRARLENSEFLRKAPSEVVEKDRDRFHSIVTEIKRLRSLIEGIQVS